MQQANPLKLSDLDVNLVTRCVRVLQHEAAVIHTSCYPWTGEKESLAQKARYDRYLREARDLTGLRDRMKAAVREAKSGDPGNG